MIIKIIHSFYYVYHSLCEIYFKQLQAQHFVFQQPSSNPIPSYLFILEFDILSLIGLNVGHTVSDLTLDILHHGLIDTLILFTSCQVWCSNSKPESVLMGLLTDPHSPSRYRLVLVQSVYTSKTGSNKNTLVCLSQSF